MSMIVGIGTDLVEVARVEKAIQKNDRFVSRFFGREERTYFEDSQAKIQTLAANFAGKEAVLKVFGTGLRGCQLSEIEILRDSLGKPVVKLSGAAAELAHQLEIDQIMISLSHTKEHAIAYAIGLRREEHVISK